MRYRVESNVDRRPSSPWFDRVPENIWDATNLGDDALAYRKSCGGSWGVYDEAGRRVA